MPAFVRRARSLLLNTAATTASRCRVCRCKLRNDNATIPWATTIRAGVRIRVTDGGQLRLANGVTLERHAAIYARAGGKVDIGRDAFIGTGVIIAAKAGITIGANALIAEYVTIRDQDHATRPGLPRCDSGFVTAPVTIGANVWLGAKATVLKGVTIGDGCVIGANAVVTHDIPAGCTAVGTPARVKKSFATPDSE